MDKRKLLYLFWLIPAYFLFLTLQQTTVYYGLRSTYHSGQNYIAEILDYNIKQVAGQRNGHVTIQFQTTDQKQVQKKLGVSGEIIARISQSKMAPIRYQKDGFIQVVFTQVYEIQKGFVLSNIAMAGVAFIICFFIGLWAHRRARRTKYEGEKELVIERVD